ncbi:MAG: CHAT domain-containing protein, partial [Planctomycetaceae bacterium]|nr:CHAT domain-containing protein [Planctomycetaceae bacterium]
MSNADYRIFLALVWREFLADETSPWNSDELPRDLSKFDESTKLAELSRSFHEQFHAGRYMQSEETAREIVALAEQSFADQPVTLAKALRNLAVALDLQAEYDEAEKLYRRSLELFSKERGYTHPEVAACLYNLAALCFAQGRYAEAEPLFKRALLIREFQTETQPGNVARTLKGLAALYTAEARYPEAESCLQRAIVLLEKSLGREHPQVLTELTNLARVYEGDGQPHEAEALYSRAFSTWDKASESVGAATLAGHFHDLALLFSRQGRYAEALAIYRKALKLREEALGHDHPELAPLLTNLAVVLDARGDKAEAEKLYRRSLEIQRKAFGNQHPSLATNLHNLAALFTDQGRFDAAEPLIAEAIILRERSTVPLGDLSGSYYLRARIMWGLGRQEAAITDLRLAINIAEQDRARIPGSEYEMAARYARFSVAFEQMVVWQSALRNVEAAFDAAEQSRARTLQDQLELQGVDLLAGLPEAQARELSRQRLETQRRLAAVQRQLRLADQPNGPDRKPLIAALDEARQQHLQAQRNCLSASPAYQLAISDQFQPVSLQSVQDWLVPRDALMLHYLIGTQHSYVFVIPAGGKPTQVWELTLDDETATVLSLPSGPLTAERVQQFLFGQAGGGLLSALNNPQRALQATPQLATLWKVLVPAEAREKLTGREIQRLFIVPDGSLGLLPFEALVVELGQEPQYLLDVGPAVVYGPSATVLFNLAQRSIAPIGDGTAPVLSVADPVYPDAAGSRVASTSSDTSAEQMPLSRYSGAGGRLTRLPYSDKESRWVGDVFKAKGIRVQQLVRQQATEGLFRSHASHRRTIHLACHGFADQKWGNLFGALALTPGETSSPDPADDGFLTLGEIYELDLRGCELAILSACQTNDGPQQRGEGVWSLSRGFLAAGVRRTVATNWLVDDEAAA